MTWFDWTLTGWWVVCMCLTVAMVGKPRKATEPTTAAITVLIFLAMIAGLLLTRGAL